MKNKELKTIWKVAKPTFIGATLFWILETIFFLILEGWHLKATNIIEIYCDKIVNRMWNVSLWLIVWICLNYIINLNKNKVG